MRLLYTKLLQIFYFVLLSFVLGLEVENNESERRFDDRCKEDADCCFTNPPSFEIRAILIPCSVSNCAGQPACSEQPVCECSANSKISNCTKKLIITVRMSNIGKTHCKNQYVVVDHVYDPNTEHKQRLLYPYVLKITQKPIMQTYRLEKESSVNEKSTELVINKNDKNYRGCKTTGEYTTCPRLMYKNKPIPYSTGFCCSCADKEHKEFNQKILNSDEDDNYYAQMNKKWQTVGKRGDPTEKSTLNDYPTSLATQEESGEAASKGGVNNYEFVSQNRPEKLIDVKKGLENSERNSFPITYGPKRLKRNEPQQQVNASLLKAFDEKVAEEFNKILNNFTKKCPLNNNMETNRILRNQFLHPRGGQDCSNTTCPPDVDPERFHQSTHCLVFSKLWYTVFKMAKPTIFHEVSVEIFEKHEDLMGHVIWHDITKGQPLVVGTTKPEDLGRDEVSASYIGQEPSPHAFGLNPEIHRLLVPEPVEACAVRNYPELKGGPHEWLVIPNYMINYDGNKCDKVGVGFEAFVKQPNRCDMPRGTCLKNQPKDLWCHDHRLEEVGQSGSFFLKYFGFLPRCPIRITKDNCKNLTMYYRSAYINSLRIELRTDHNLVLRPHAAAVITEVYVDSTNYIKSTVTIKVTNNGLVYGIFYVALTDCPLDMPASFNNIQSKSVMIPPQHQHIFMVEIMCSLPAKKFYCSVEAKNVRNELLAFRRIRFQKDDRCLCLWHCVCTCLEADEGLQCQPLPFDHYNAAGFHGGLPMVADYVQFTLIEELMTIFYHLFLTMTLILILMGILKGSIGIFYAPIGEWGLCCMLGLPKPMKGYHEKSLKGRIVVYDDCGWPIHPESRKRVRNVSKVTEFCINIIFFLIYPLVMINVIVKRMFFIDSTDESEQQPCCLCGRRHPTGECPSLGILQGFRYFEKLIRKEGKNCPRRDSSVQYSSTDNFDCSCY